MIEPVLRDPVDQLEPAGRDNLGPSLWRVIGKMEWGACSIIATGSLVASWAKKRKGAIAQSSIGALGPLHISPIPEPLTPEVKVESRDSPKTALPPSNETTFQIKDRFAELPYSEEDQDHIRFIIHGLARGEYISKGLEMRQRGAKIEHLHPFRFLWTIFSDPVLKGLMPNVFSSWITRSGFMTGVNRGMGRETSGRNLDRIEPYIASFASSVGTTAEAIRPLILDGTQNGDWRELVAHLIGVPSLK